MTTPLDRRTMLRGMGTALALPWLEAMVPGGVGRVAQAARAATRPPVRLGFLFVPNGVNPAEWMPSSDVGNGSRDFVLPPSLTPLSTVREHVTVHAGLDHRNAKALGDGPGDHARSAACFLTGAHPRKTSGSDILNGISIDQAIAGKLQGKTRFASLELGCDPGLTGGNCDSGYSCAYSANISWRTPRTPMAKETSPRALFERMFMDGPAGESASARVRRLQSRKSILDAVRDDTRRLSSQLGGRDRMKLEEYLDGVRELERRIELVEGAEQDPTEWGLSQLPKGIPGNYAEHIDIMADLMLVGFRLDLTRVATFMWANEGSNRTFPMVDVREGHHHLSHHSNDEGKVDAIRRIDQWQCDRFARIVQKFQDARDEDGGRLLDNTLLLFGSAICDGNRHNHDNLPILVAGRGGGAADAGRLVRHAPGTPLCNLYQSLALAGGVDLARFGDSTGVAGL
ncbi:MAG: DUF1552 domain-containing protein [Phycisphaerales bacterium]|nr:DUF1552 domain-containing protein [Phycisphaerales bacterium]